MTNNKNATRYYSGKQEREIAKKVNGRLSANSGAATFATGDIISKDFIIEAKTCMQPKSSFSIKKDWLDKLKEEQFASGKLYRALCFDYGDNKDRYYILDEKTFLQFINMLS